MFISKLQYFFGNSVIMQIVKLKICSTADAETFFIEISLNFLKNMIVSLQDTRTDELSISDGVISEDGQMQVHSHCISNPHPLPLYLREITTMLKTFIIAFVSPKSMTAI